MNDHLLSDDQVLDALLRAAAPAALADDGFVTRTMAAVDAANAALPARRRTAAPSPLAIARAIAAEQRRHDVQARSWRWAMAGVAVGYLLMLVSVAASPSGLHLGATSPSQFVPLAAMTAIGALWVAWRTLRSV